MTDQPTPAPADLRQRIAEALMRWAEGNNAPQYAAIRRPETVTKNAYARADAVLAELKRELDALAEYENTINWHTTCTSCARVLDSAHRETERAEQAEAAIARVRDLRDDLRGITGARYIADALDTILVGPISDPAAGPTVAECADNDRRWPLEKHGE
ncbi:hypothetical protein ACFZAR_05475 [Streptomyces sp. NPDC008222]|uniref:hypothetical protein n=1 Tax=Streptomyces sp. NPDC008222 TaxID=3364820 RepID=UPI0036E2EA60